MAATPKTVKVTANTSVSGIDLRDMMAEAQSRFDEMANVPWTIVSVDVWGNEDVASKQGMSQLWRATFNAEASL